MTLRWLFASCALSGASIVACGADTGGPAAGGAGSAGTGVSTGASSTTGTGTTAGSSGSTDVTGAGGQGGSPYFPVVGGTGGTPSTGGGTGGADAIDGGVGSVASTCNGAALCDSFERPMLGPDWVLDNTAPTVIEMVTNKGHTGNNSVHISFGTGTTQSYISESKTFPAMGNTFWGRAWIFSMVPLGGHQIYIEARVAGGGDHTGVRTANTFDTKGNLGLNLESSDASKNSMVKMPSGTWNCYEWQITGIGGMGTFSAWVDGTMIGTQTGVIPALGRQRIGLQRYAAGTAGEMWIDDVAIGSERINCTP